MPEKQYQDEMSLAPKEILFRGHRIELITEEGAIPFLETHISLMTPILEFYWTLDPKIVTRLTQFRSINAPTKTLYGSFPANAQNSFPSRDTLGIDFFNRGMDTQLAHRISPTETSHQPGFIDNFSATLAHEMAHGGSDWPKVFPSDTSFNKDFWMEWQKQFGWRTVYQTIQDENGKFHLSTKPMEGWFRNADGRWQNKEYVILQDVFTFYPERCIGGLNSYASSIHLGEDICDSVAAFVLGSPLLDAAKREMIKTKIDLYRTLITQRSRISVGQE